MWIVFFALSLAGGPDCQTVVQTLDGREFVGQLLQLDHNGATLETVQDRKTSLPLSDLLTLILQTDTVELGRPHAESARNAPNGAVEIELDDGSIVLGRRFAAHDNTAGFSLFAPGGEQPAVELAMQRIVAACLQPADVTMDGAWKHLLKQHCAENVAADLLVINKNGSLDYHRGVLGDISRDIVEFNFDGDTLSVPRRKVFGLIWHRAVGGDLPSAVCHVQCSDGSCWAARSIEFRQGRFVFDTPGGIEVSLPQSAVKRLDFSAGKILYLDEFVPEHVDWTPYFGHRDDLPARRLLSAPRFGGDENSEPLCLRGKRFSRGMMLHSRTELTYRLPDGFSRFRATAGIDDRARPGGHVRLVIYGQQRVLFDQPVSGTDPPLELDIDIADVRRLRILVDYGEELDTGDRLDLGEARLIK